MGRRRDEEQTRQNRTQNGVRRHDGGYGDHQGRPRDYRDEARYGPYYDRNGDRYYESEHGDRYYEGYDASYYRNRDSEREYYWRERESRQETRRTVYMVLGSICVAMIALVAVMAVTGDDSSQTAGQAPQQAQPVPQQQAQQAPQPGTPQQPQAPQSPEVPGQNPASSEQVEGLRASIERQFAELQQSINQLRLEIWSFFGQQQQQGTSS